MSIFFISSSKTCIFLLLALVCLFRCKTQTIQKQPHTFLQKYLQFSEVDLVAMEKGKIVTKLPKPMNKGEIAACGVVRVNTSSERFVEKLRDIETFKESEAVLQIRKFSSPPIPNDLSGLTLDDDDLDALRRCKVGNCSVKLPASMIGRLRQEIDWSAPNYKERVTTIFRQFLVDYVNAYLLNGDAALVEYRDKNYSLRLASESHSLLRNPPYLSEYVPEFLKYLEDFPKGHLPGAENFVYWSKEKFGLKPVVSITHVAIHTINKGAAFRAIAISKQLYASHYFEASLGLTILADADADPSKPGVYLTYLNRSQVDLLRSGLISLRRALVGGRIRKGLQMNLQLTKQKLEAETKLTGFLFETFSLVAKSGAQKRERTIC